MKILSPLLLMGDAVELGEVNFWHEKNVCPVVDYDINRADVLIAEVVEGSVVVMFGFDFAFQPEREWLG